MYRSFRPARRKPARGLASALAISLGLVGAAFGSAALVPAPAMAQSYSRDFVRAYEPVANVVNEEGADVASVSGQFPALIEAASSPDERFAVGNLILMAGSKASNPQWQRQGLELMVESGQTPEEQLGQFQFFIGNLAFQDQDYAAARAALEASQQAGYSDPETDVQGLIAETYFAEGNGQGGIEYIKSAAAGGQVPENMLLKALQSAYDQNLNSEALEVSGLLVRSYPTERNWMNSLQVIGAMHEFQPQQQLDLLRLMRETGAISDRSEYVTYIEAADPRIMSNEVNAVLAEAVAAGQLSTGDAYYTEVKGIADQRAPEDQSEAPGMVAEAEGSSDPMLAMEAGDVVYSLGDFAQAEAMYQIAVDNGAADRETALTRLGIAQAKQGKFAEAQATLGQVTGERAPIAQMWAAYAETQGGGAGAGG